MGRTARDNRDMPHPRPVERIELKEGHHKLRLLLVILLVLIGAGCIGYAINSLLTADKGWTVIEALNSSSADGAKELVLRYELGRDQNSPTAEKRLLTAAYTQALQEAYRLYDANSIYEDVHNPAYLNAHIGEKVEIPPQLYDAFALYEKQGIRAIYLGPIYKCYYSLFYSTEDYEAQEMDPYRNSDLKDAFEKYLSYASDPAHVSLELLPDYCVNLHVSQEFQDYLDAEWAGEGLIDFGWTRNAFVVDHIADTLTQAGWTHGILSSYDGYVRKLGEEEETAKDSIEVTSDDGSQESREAPLEGISQDSKEASVDGSLQKGKDASSEGSPIESGYDGTVGTETARSIVILQASPRSEMDAGWFYRYEDGEMRVPYVDPADGLCKASAEKIIGYSKKAGAAEILMALWDYYVAEEADLQKLEKLPEEINYLQ